MKTNYHSPCVLSLIYCRCWDCTGDLCVMSVTCWVPINPPPTCRRHHWSQGELEAAAAPSFPRALWWRRTLCWRSFGDYQEYGLRRRKRVNSGELSNQTIWMRGGLHAVTDVCAPVMALRISVAAASRISSDACSLYQAVWGVQIKLGASFRGPWEKLQAGKEMKRWIRKKTLSIFFTYLMV